MKLYIRQKVFSWADNFTIKDENGEDKYYVKGELFSWGKKLHIYNTLDQEIAFIQQKVFSLMPKFFVYVEGNQIAEIVKEFTFLKPKYHIKGLDWEINGSFMAHDYSIVAQGLPIVSIHKEWMTFGDCYALDITNEQDEIIALSVTLAIDCVLAAESSAATSAGAAN